MSARLFSVPTWTVFAALLLSTQFLAQPFVWRNFALHDIAAGWLAIFRNRLIVTSCVALVIGAVMTLPGLSVASRRALAAVGIVAGAFAGESVLSWADFEGQAIGAPLMLLRVSRWCIVGLAVASIYLLYQRAAAGRASIHAASLRAVRIERQAVEARLQLLRSQIEPHFLFNTLATIRSLHRSAPVEGAALLTNFIDYLRAAIPDAANAESLLGEEVTLVRAYLGVVCVRLSGRLTWSMDMDGSLASQPFPRLALATLAENAVKHGIVPAEAGGHVSIVVRRIDAFVETSVIDTGVGLSIAGGGSGIGLANTRARLLSQYGGAARLTLDHNRPRGVRASILIPFRDAPS